MAEEERDFLLRQIQQMAKGLGKFLGVQQIKEIIQVDEAGQGDLADDEIESMILVAKIEVIAAENQMSTGILSSKLDISSERLKELFGNEAYATEDELAKLHQFVDRHEAY